MIAWMTGRTPRFPPPDKALPGGLVAVGGRLDVEWLVEAYRRGIFPWFAPGDPVLWWSPDPRFVLRTDALHVPRSLRKFMRRTGWVVTADRAFDAVVAGCAEAPRPGQGGTWITPEMRRAYSALHRVGMAHSVEVWQGNALVGGLYGVAVGRAFSGESMFHRAANASKLALVVTVEWLRSQGVPLVDCQLYTDNLARFGADAMPRRAFLDEWAALTAEPPLPYRWPWCWTRSTGLWTPEERAL